jgi:uncharacterized membrane protein
MGNTFYNWTTILIVKLSYIYNKNMTFVITRENAYFALCVLLFILQVYQHSKVVKLKKDFQSLANQVMILFFSVKMKQDEQKETDNKQTF